MKRGQTEPFLHVSPGSNTTCGVAKALSHSIGTIARRRKSNNVSL